MLSMFCHCFLLVKIIVMASFVFRFGSVKCLVALRSVDKNKNKNTQKNAGVCGLLFLVIIFFYVTELT